VDESNDAIADLLEHLATWEELQGSVPFKIMAFRNAAEALLMLDRPVADMVRAGEDLTEIESIGKGIAKRIAEIVAEGPARYRERFENEVGPGLFELLRIPGLGPKRVRVLRDELEVRSPEDLRDACLAGRVKELEGFGAKTEERLLRRARRALGETED
jgi:DNA polymerase (family 10)